MSDKETPTLKELNAISDLLEVAEDLIKKANHASQESTAFILSEEGAEFANHCLGQAYITSSKAACLLNDALVLMEKIRGRQEDQES